MSGAGINIIANIQAREILAALERLRNKSGNLGPAMANIGEELLRSTQRRFMLMTGPDGKRWQRLTDASKASKIAKGQNPRKILTGRGYLRDSIRYQANDNSVRIGTNRIYGAIHQFGGKTKAHVIKPRNKKALAWPGGRHPVRGVNHPGSNFPARPYLGLSRTDRERILLITADHFAMGR